jgi:hypothetical protein
MKKALLFLFFLTPLSSWAYVENVTHGYPNCMACHTSPAGGNLLTEYGRSLSKELMSTWGVSENFEQHLFGAWTAPEKLSEKVSVGADVRYIQVYTENDDAKTGRKFLMQQNIELGLHFGNTTLVGAFGTQEGPDGTPERGQFLSERHYLLWSPAPTSRVRVGKFRQRFGINDPNHRRFVKNLFGFGSNSETYNLEFTQLYEKYDISVSAGLGQLDEPRASGQERNISGTFTHYLDGKSHLGGSLLIGESDVQRRTLAGAFTVIPISEEWIGLFEADYESNYLDSAPADEIKTIATSGKLGHRPFKGFMWYTVFEHYSTDSTSGYELVTSPGLGIQWFPIPHFEIHTEYQHRTFSTDPGNPTHYGWIQLHFYL